MLDLPMTNGPNLVGSYVMQMFTAQSMIPCNRSDRYFDLFGSSTRAEERIRSLSNESLTCFLVSVFLTRMKFHGWENPTDGAWCAAFKIRVSTCSSIGSGVKCDLTSRLENTAL